MLIKGKVKTVTADRVKPAHTERTPKNERTRQPKATPTLKPMTSQPTAKILRASDGRSRHTKYYYVEAFWERSLHEAKFERTVYDKDKENSSSG